MTDPRIVRLLEASRPGATVWLTSSGVSLWPLVLSGDVLKVERVSAADVHPGDIAVVSYGALLVAHIVVQRGPVVTASTAGAEDPPGGEVLGRVIAVRRGATEVPVLRLLAPALRWLPPLARLGRRIGPVRAMARRLRDGGRTGQ